MRELLASLVLSFATVALTVTVALNATLMESQKAISSYVNVWEEEIARELLLEKRTDLFEKIRSQIPELTKTIDAKTFATKNETLLPPGSECDSSLKQSLAVTLYGNPAGTLEFCHSRNKLIAAATRSPIFTFGLLFSVLISIGLPGVSFLRRREATMKKRALEAELETSKAVADLARSVAHDIRAPLSALNAVTQTEDDLNELRPLLVKATERVHSIADDLLKRSREAQNRNEDPLASIRTVIDQARHTSPAIEIHLEAEGTKHTVIPPHTQLALTQLDRVVSNLVMNSIEALNANLDQTRLSAATKPQIRVRLKVQSRPWALRSRFREKLALTVEDNGPGIPDSIRSQIGLKPVTFGKENGNGLGLMSAQNFATKVGGQMQIKSSKLGTKITVEVPIR